jgi:hypothetical protein
MIVPHEGAGMSDQSASRPRERFEATVHAGEADRPDERLAALDVDRVPDPAGGVRILAGLDECAALVREGFEVRLLRAVTAGPALPEDARFRDDDVRAWLEDRLRGIPREDGEG